MPVRQKMTTEVAFKSKVADVFIATRELSDFCEANPQYRTILDDAIAKATEPRKRGKRNAPLPEGI